MSTYVQHPLINEIDASDAPRFLTFEEIQRIVDNLPENTIPYPKDAEFIRKQIQENIAKELKSQQVCPSGIIEIINEIRKQHKESLLERGTPIGFTSSEAVGAINTQATLNTFHSSGQKNDLGNDSIKDIIFARTNITTPRAIIHFKSKTLSVEDVLMMRSNLVAVFINSLMLSKNKSYNIFRTREYKYEWWYITKQEIPTLSMTFIRLYFDVKKLYMYKVTLQDIMNTLLRGEGNEDMIKIVISPMSYGYVDIFPLIVENGKTISTIEKTEVSCKSTVSMPSLPQIFRKSKDERYSTEYIVESSFLESTLIPSLSTIRLKGVAGIKNLQPVIEDVTSVILKEEKMKESSYLDERYHKYVLLDRIWLVKLNFIKMKTMGVTLENVIQLYETAGIETILVSDDKLEFIVKTPALSYVDGNGKQMIRDSSGYFYVIRDFKNKFIILEDGRTARRVTSDNLRFDDNEAMWIENIGLDVNTNKPINIFRSLEEVISSDKGTFVITETAESDNVIYEKADMLITGKSQSPLDIIKNNILEAEKNYEIEKKIDKNLRRPLIIRQSEYVFAYSDLDLSNNFVSKNIMKDLLSLRFLDNKKTYVNSMHIIRNTLGVEAARKYIHNALYNSIFGRGSYVHPQNISIIAEIMTNKGVCSGATFNGISRQPGGHLYISTVEKAGEVNISEAFAGRKEDMRNVSASIFVGNRMSVGTGSFNIGQKIIENGVERISVNDELFTVLEGDDRFKEQMKLASLETSKPLNDFEDDPDKNFFDELDKFETFNIVNEAPETFSTEEDFDRRSGVVFGKLAKPLIEKKQVKNYVKPVTSSGVSMPDEKLSGMIMSSSYSSKNSVNNERKRLGKNSDTMSIIGTKALEKLKSRKSEKVNAFGMFDQGDNSIFNKFRRSEPKVKFEQENNEGDDRDDGDRERDGDDNREGDDGDDGDDRDGDNDDDSDRGNEEDLLPGIDFGEVEFNKTGVKNIDYDKLKNIF